MSCLLCESLYHTSPYCDKYICDKERKNIVFSKNYYYLSSSHKTCYICFSRHHNTIYCPDRFNVSMTFVPKIDNDLFPRFLQLFKLEEQYQLAFLSPKIFNSLKTKKFNINSNSRPFKNTSDSNVVISDSFYLPQKRICLPPLETLVFKCENLYIKNVSWLSASEFLLMLTSTLKRLNCINVRLTPSVSFSSIIKAAPNLNYIYLVKTDIATKNWLDTIILWEQRRKVQMLRMTITDLKFSVKNLAKFLEVMY